MTATELLTSVLFFIGGSKRHRDLNEISTTKDPVSWLLWMKTAIIVVLIAMHIANCVSEQFSSANLTQPKYAEALILVELFYIYNLIFVIRILYKENGRRLSEVWYSSMLLYVSNILFAGGILCYFTFVEDAQLVSLYHV